MMEATLAFLGQRASLGQAARLRPFFLAVSTIETHPGLDVQDPKRRYGDGQSPVLNRFHNFDQQFGRFFTAFLESAFVDNTIVILTADHAHAPDVDFRRVTGPAYEAQYFDPIVLLMFSRVHALAAEYQAYRSSIDFAPTALHLLGLRGEKNHFLGRSLLAAARPDEEALGMVYGRHLLRLSPMHRSIVALSRETCDLLAEDAGAIDCHLFRGTLYFQELMRQGRLWPGEQAD